MMKKILTGRRGLFILLVVLIIVLNFGRSSLLMNQKWLQQQEFSFFDYAQIRASSSVSERIIIVGMTEQDIKQLGVDTLEDKTLATLIEKIKQQKPKAIGLDIIRDLPVGEGIEKLEAIYRLTPNLYGVGKFTGIENDPYSVKIKPPAILEEKRQIGDVSIMVDDDGVVRRGNLFPTTGENGLPIPSLGLIVAHRYLIDSGYEEKTSSSKDLQLGDVIFPIFQASDGGYINADASGYQILMNWLHPPQSFPQVSVTDVLSENVPIDFFKDKIVFIGYYTIASKKNIFYSPFSSKIHNQTPQSIFGVEIHANLADYLLSAVIDGKPLLKAVPEPLEALILSFWIILTGILIWLLKIIKPPVALVGAGFALATLLTWLCFELNYQIFTLGWWLPVFPTTAILLTAVLTLFYIFRERNLEYIENLELKVKERTLELESALRDLEQQKHQLIEQQNQLVEQQKQLIEQEKLAFLGRLTAGFCHQFKNPLALLKHGFATVIRNVNNSEKLRNLKDKEPIIQLLLDLQEPIDKLELLFKLILISPSQKKVVWLETTPNKFVKTVISSATRFCGQSLPCSIEFILDPQLDNNFSVPQQLEIPVFNIVENAIDAILEREKKDSSFTPFIRVQTNMLQEKWEITITDNGGGISPHIQAQLFEPFVTTKSDCQGIGLGLYISQEVMLNLIKGEILNDSSEHTKFKLIIPLLNRELVVCQDIIDGFDPP